MSKPGPHVIITEPELTKAKQIIDSLPYRDELLVAFAVVLTSQGKLDQATIGEVLGVSQSTVKRMIKDFKTKCSASAEKENNTPSWGGDRRSILTWEEENEVLDQMTPETIQGHVVTVGDIQSALETKAGRKMSRQTVYNILHRHKWRKVVPDNVHPKNDPENLDEFKKNVPGGGAHGNPPVRTGGETSHNVSGRSALWTIASGSHSLDALWSSTIGGNSD